MLFQQPQVINLKEYYCGEGVIFDGKVAFPFKITNFNKNHTPTLDEIKKGKKETHWMWFIFPQIKGLGKSDTANLYAINDLKEATDYLEHPILGKHLIEISELLLTFKMKSADGIFGDLDARKLRSCMTLFSLVENANPIFQEILDAFFSGETDPLTLSIINSTIKSVDEPVAL